VHVAKQRVAVPYVMKCCTLIELRPDYLIQCCTTVCAQWVHSQALKHKSHGLDLLPLRYISTTAGYPSLSHEEFITAFVVMLNYACKACDTGDLVIVNGNSWHCSLMQANIGCLLWRLS